MCRDILTTLDAALKIFLAQIGGEYFDG